MLLAAGLVASMAPTSGYAYSLEQQQACTPDAFRLCSSEIPDVERITACMIRNRSQLSPECRVFFKHGREAGEVDPSSRPRLHRIKRSRADAS